MFNLNLQLFATLGVFPVHNNKFKINTAGRDDTLPDTMVIVNLVQALTEI